MLTRLEAKTLRPDGAGAGLNLTRASLDAATKYPWFRDAAHGPTAKFGVYDDDASVFEWLRGTSPEYRRCVEAQVMDFADDVAYSVHDVEDAVVSGRLVPGRLDDAEERARVAGMVRDWYVPDAEPAEVLQALDRLRALPASWCCWRARPAATSGSARSTGHGARLPPSRT